MKPALASVDAGAARDYKNQVNRLRDAIKARAKSINEQLKKTTKRREVDRAADEHR